MILVDTDILIAHLRGAPVAKEWLLRSRAESLLAVSVVSIAELTGGMRSAERQDVWRLLSTLRAEPVTDVIARRAGEWLRRYRRSHTGIGLADHLIAATADVRGSELATLNVRHFPMFDDLEAPFQI